jgi:hypothetical protein
MSARALFLLLSFAAPAVDAQQAAPSPIGDPIVVWSVGSPHTENIPGTSVPLDLELKAAAIGTSIRIQAFPAKGFADLLFQAFNAHKEPDIISFDNIGVLDGVRTTLGVFTGIESNPLVSKSLIEVTGSFRSLTPVSGGWQYLLSTSRNYETARTLAIQPAQCRAGAPPNPISPEVMSLSLTLANAYLEQVPSLLSYNDPDRIIAPGNRIGPVHADTSAICFSSGNDSLVFVSLTSIYESPKAIGQRPVMLVLRKQAGPWRLLAIGSDPISNTAFATQIERITALLQQNSDSSPPNPAQLLSPPDGQRLGDFVWQPSPSQNVIAEIVEFDYQNDTRLILHLRRQNRTTAPATDEVSEGMLWQRASEWKWRVWSISDSGAISLSDSRSFHY